jgi:hypothetical protein
MRAIGDEAHFVTSKNAGPVLLTLDSVFSDEATYRTFKSRRVLDRQVIAGLCGIPEGDVLKTIEFDPAYAVKVTMKRPMGSDALGETDVYGAQQHVVPMLNEIDCPRTGRGVRGGAANIEIS